MLFDVALQAAIATNDFSNFFEYTFDTTNAQHIKLFVHPPKGLYYRASTVE